MQQNPHGSASFNARNEGHGTDQRYQGDYPHQALTNNFMVNDPKSREEEARNDGGPRSADMMQKQYNQYDHSQNNGASQQPG